MFIGPRGLGREYDYEYHNIITTHEALKRGIVVLVDAVLTINGYNYTSSYIYYAAADRYRESERECMQRDMPWMTVDTRE